MILSSPLFLAVAATDSALAVGRVPAPGAVLPAVLMAAGLPLARAVRPLRPSGAVPVRLFASYPPVL